MATPTLQSQITFDPTQETASQIWNQLQTPTRRMISCTIAEIPSPPSGRLAGWLWGDVRNDIQQFVRFSTVEVLFGSETAIVLPDEFQGVIWRVSFFPIEKMTPRNGTFRFYTI